MLDEATPLEMEQTKIKMQLAARIEDCMRDKGWSKSQFTEKAGKNPSEITKWLSGTQNFTVDVLTDIATTPGVELTALPPTTSFTMQIRGIKLQSSYDD